MVKPYEWFQDETWLQAVHTNYTLQSMNADHGRAVLHNVRNFTNYLQVKFSRLWENEKTRTWRDFDEYLAIGLCHCLDWRSRNLWSQGLPDDERLDQAHGQQAFRAWKLHRAREDPGITSGNRFWTYLDVLCVSQLLAKCIMNCGCDRRSLAQSIAKISACEAWPKSSAFLSLGCTIVAT